jgi:hypothetical protein
MENWGMSLETLPAGFFYTTVTPVDLSLPMVSCLRGGKGRGGVLQD